MSDLLANLRDAYDFRLKSHEKIVPMGGGEIKQLIDALADLKSDKWWYAKAERRYLYPDACADIVRERLKGGKQT